MTVIILAVLALAVGFLVVEAGMKRWLDEEDEGPH
jgi:hypothetical protein